MADDEELLTGGSTEARMSDVDALMWSIERDPMLRSTITTVLVFDHSPDHDRLAAKLDRASRSFLRLRQRVVANPVSIAPPRWENDPSFDLDYHLRQAGCPGAGRLEDVLALAGPLSVSGFDPARPLWEMVMVEGMADGRAALVVKLHHTITDGMGAVKLAMELFDLEPSPPDAGPMPELPRSQRLNQWERVVDAWSYEQRWALDTAGRMIPSLAGGLARLIWSPGPTAGRLREVTSSVGRTVGPGTHPLSPIMTGRSLSAQLDTLAVSLPDAKVAAKAAGCKLNDFFLAGVLGGLRRYHDQHGTKPETLRMGMAISLRDPADREVGGNQFLPLRFIVPLQVEDPVAGMRALHELVARQRAEPALELADALAAVARRLPTSAQVALLGGMLRSVDVIASNVAGVPIPVYLAGARMEAQYAFGPRSGAAVNVTLLSYLDQLYLGLNIDPAAVPDRESLLACLGDSFDELLKVAP
ncbi:MAG: WS/DGAT domain-containing protein [Actinomycetota bacterium]|nr:WS/DGAT domain-containing protein [Actinomycetota bacterium]